MSKLVAVKRMNVNGHMVTKWVKPDGSTATSALPGPTTVSADAVRAANNVGRRLKDLIDFQPMTVPSEIKLQDIEEKLHSLPQDTLKMLDEVTGRDEDPYLRCIIVSALKHWDSQKIDDIVQVYTHLDPELSGDISQYTDWGKLGFDGHQIIVSAIRGIASHPIEGLDYTADGTRLLRDHSEETLEKVVAVYNTINLIEENLTEAGLVYSDTEKGSWIANPDLASLVVQHYDRNEEVLSVMEDRETADPEIIRAVLEAGHSALSEGAL